MLVAHGCCGRRRARPPARLGVLTSFGAAPRSPPVPSGPSGALHTSGACGACVVARRLEVQPGPAAAHGHRSRVLRTPQCGLACRAGILGRSAACCYKRRQSDGFFAENQGFWTQIDDVCNGYWPRVLWTGPDAAHGRCGQALPTRRPGCLKPLSPLRACACVRLKPPSPLRVRNGRFWCSFQVQW